MDKIRLLHIPKTGGTSLQECLGRIYQGPRFLFSGDLKKDLEAYREMGPEKQANIVLFAGHSPRITGIPGIDDLPTITLFRDPVCRVKSFCQHVIKRVASNS